MNGQDWITVGPRVCHGVILPASAGWSYGTNLGFVKQRVRYWLEEYEWRAVEARLNRLPHYHAAVGDYRIHVIHARGSGPHPLPLVVTHGWPRSFVEFEAVIEPLAYPERFGRPGRRRLGRDRAEHAGLWLVLRAVGADHDPRHRARCGTS